MGAFDDLIPKDAPANAFADLVPKKEQVSQGHALLEGGLSGASANFRDEIYGASEASGLPHVLGGLRAPVGAARLGYEYLIGQPGSATERYTEARDKVRATQKAAQEQWPKTYVAGEVGGALALPASKVLQAPTMAGRMGRSAAVGAGYGGLSGVGEAETPEEMATKGLTGAVVGGGAGAIAPPLVEGAIQGASYVAKPIVNAVRGAFDPETEAARRVVSAIQRDAKADPTAETRLTPGEFVGAHQEGSPVKFIDLGGDLTRRVADTAGTVSPEGKVILNSVLNDRFEGQTNRLTGWLNNTFHYPNATAQQDALEQIGKTVNSAAYKKAYAAGDKPIWSPELERLVGSDAVQDAIKTAVTKGKDRAIAEGYGGFNSPVKVTPDGRIEFQTGKSGVPTYPNLQFWDYTFRELRDSATQALRAGRGEEYNRLNGLVKMLRSELDTQVPQFANARAGAAKFFGADDALEAGKNFVSAKMKNDEAREALRKMSPVEKQLFQDGYVSDLVKKLSETGDRRNALNQLSQSPAGRERLSMVMGPTKAREFEAMLRVEGIMDMSRAAVNGNSWTARRLYDLGLVGGAGLGASGTYHMDPKEMATGAIIGAIASGGKKIDQRVMQNVAKMLVSDDPKLLSKGIQSLAKNYGFMSALRSTDQRIAKAAAQEAHKVPAMQSMGMSRAEGDQDVPRPSQ